MVVSSCPGTHWQNNSGTTWMYDFIGKGHRPLVVNDERLLKQNGTFLRVKVNTFRI